MRIVLFFLLAAGLASPAQADWYEASSDNFVVYADDREKDVQKFAEMLERYHAAMEFVLSRNLPKPTPSNRVTIYAVGGDRAIKRLAGEGASNIAGFYIPRAGGSAAFVQDVRPTSNQIDFSMTVLLHEYAHHFLISSSRHAMPRWISEGAAEFFASANFPRDGSVGVGRPALHRAGELFYSVDVSVQELLDDELYLKGKGKSHDAYYGRSWLLYHYLTFDEERTGQLKNYWQSVAAGTPSLKAGEAAFGDLDKLQKDLDRYLKTSRMLSFSLKPEWLETGTVTVRKLSEGHAEMMPVIIRSKRGVDHETAPEVLVDAREVAARYPNDAYVFAALAEAEHDAGNHQLAINAADKALTLDSSNKDALVQKGLAMFELAHDADDRQAAYTAAMQPFSLLNGLENDHPLPLIHFYRSFAERGARPTDLAKAALERAALVARFDQSLWMNTGIMQAEDGRIAAAIESLSPVAANPHGGSMARSAEALIAALKNAKEGEPFSTASTLTLASIATEVDVPDDSDDGSD